MPASCTRTVPFDVVMTATSSPVGWYSGVYCAMGRLLFVCLLSCAHAKRGESIAYKGEV